jgi:hypothetical protein
LLRDEELVDLIAASGGKWVFIGMESIDPANLKDLNKGFNKPGEYAAVLERLARRNVYAITSFIFGMDNDTVGVAERTLQQVRTWPPGLPIFGLLTRCQPRLCTNGWRPLVGLRGLSTGRSSSHSRWPTSH